MFPGIVSSLSHLSQHTSPPDVHVTLPRYCCTIDTCANPLPSVSFKFTSWNCDESVQNSI